MKNKKQYYFLFKIIRRHILTSDIISLYRLGKRCFITEKKQLFLLKYLKGVRCLDYNNMNRRASRSAYNYDNDRRVSKTVNNKRRENNADFSDFKKKRPVSPNPQVRYSAPNQTASHSARRPSQNHPQRKTNNPAEFNQQRPQNIRKKNQNSNNKNKIKK